jgi:hypothetical protein
MAALKRKREMKWRGDGVCLIIASAMAGSIYRIEEILWLM